MAEEKKKPWYEGWRKLAGAIIGMGTGIYLIVQGQYELGAGLVITSIGIFTAGNIAEHKIENGNKKETETPSKEVIK